MTTSDPTSIVSMLATRLAESADREAIWTKSDEWYSRTWSEVGRDALRLAKWMVSQGVECGDRVAQLSENRYEWIITDLATHIIGGVHVPIHAPLTGTQASFQIRASGSRLVLLSTNEQVEKLAACGEELPSQTRYYSYDPTLQVIGTQRCECLPQVLAAFDERGCDELLQRAVANATGDDLVTILYTSGTTGEPKGVMLSNRNLVSNTLAAAKPLMQSPEDVRLTFLPLSHIFARTCDLYTWLASGSQLALAESKETVIADCASVRPTLLNAVPYFFEKLSHALASVDFTANPNALKEALGGRIRLCCSGGAALPNHVFDFFTSHGVPLLQGYGLTETSPVITLSTEQSVKRGAVGRAIPDIDLKIEEDGEISTRGPHVMLGYFNNQAATDEVLRDGWFRTGDLGRLDEDGFLFITGRKKEIIVTSGGKNVAPGYLESLLAQDALIAQAVVFGDDRKFLTALIVPEMSALTKELNLPQANLADAQDILASRETVMLFEDRIASRLADVSHYEQIQKFTLMSRSFTIESGEMTPKLTLRRDVIRTNCQHLIDAMYLEQ
ncbi:MAG: long-chain fatty acid--CoA ligase [Planctomycetaceae bacterium]|nr:long-chain fatty acid--CoA ligase [Planctomycetaceae bacterium]